MHDFACMFTPETCNQTCQAKPATKTSEVQTLQQFKDAMVQCELITGSEIMDGDQNDNDDEEDLQDPDWLPDDYVEEDGEESDETDEEM